MLHLFQWSNDDQLSGKTRLGSDGNTKIMFSKVKVFKLNCSGVLTVSHSTGWRHLEFDQDEEKTLIQMDRVSIKNPKKRLPKPDSIQECHKNDNHTHRKWCNNIY